MSWFEEWFDSPLYEMLYASRNKEEAERMANLIQREMPPEKYQEILDLGCGRGRHSITMAERGYSVTGVDLSEEAIKKARMKAANKGLNNVTFQTGDMRQPLNREFDAIVNLFTTFGYFLDDDENINILKSSREMLRNKGLFLIDFLNAEYVSSNLIRKESGSYEGMTYRIEREIKQGMVFKRIRFSGRSIPGPAEYLERVKLYDLDWFKKSFKDTGFTLQKTYGDYSGSDYLPEESPRLLMIAKK